MILKIDKKINCKEYLVNMGFSRNVLPKIKYSLYNNNHKIKLYETLEVGQLEIRLNDYDSSIKRIKEDINIIYEDDYILIINKKKNECIMPNKGHIDNNLIGKVMNYYDSINLLQTVHVLTRLDYDTEGLVFICKYKDLCNLFKIKDKLYYVVAQGLVDDCVVEGFILKDEGIKRKMSDKGDYSKTEFKRIKYNNNTLLEARLYTGRTHQIRVHLKSIDHPIIGDRLYSSGNNLLLQCYKIGFYHPILKKQMEIEIPLDEDFLEYL